MATGISMESLDIGLNELQRHLENPNRSFMTLEGGSLRCVSCDEDDDGFDTRTDPLLAKIMMNCRSKTGEVFAEVICDPKSEREMSALLERTFSTSNTAATEAITKEMEWVDITSEKTEQPTKTRSVVAKVCEVIIKFFRDFRANRVLTTLQPLLLNLGVLNSSMTETVAKLDEVNSQLHILKERLNALPPTGADCEVEAIHQDYILLLKTFNELSLTFDVQRRAKNSCQQSIARVVKKEHCIINSENFKEHQALATLAKQVATNVLYSEDRNYQYGLALILKGNQCASEIQEKILNMLVDF